MLMLIHLLLSPAVLHMIPYLVSAVAVITPAVRKLWTLVAEIITFFDKRAERKATVQARITAKSSESSVGKKLVKELKPAIGGTMPTYDELLKRVAELTKRVDSLSNTMQLPPPAPPSHSIHSSAA